MFAKVSNMDAISRQNLVHIEKNKVYYDDGDYWFVLCIQHHVSLATH